MILQEYMHEKEGADGFDDWLKEKQDTEQEEINEDTEVSEKDDSDAKPEEKED